MSHDEASAAQAARSLRLLVRLVSRGIPVIAALGLVADDAASQGGAAGAALAQLAARAVEAVASGADLAAALASFGPEAGQTIAAGERTGRLEQALADVAAWLADGDDDLLALRRLSLLDAGQRAAAARHELEARVGASLTAVVFHDHQEHPDRLIEGLARGRAGALLVARRARARGTTPPLRDELALLFHLWALLESCGVYEGRFDVLASALEGGPLAGPIEELRRAGREGGAGTYTEVLEGHPRLFVNSLVALVRLMECCGSAVDTFRTLGEGLDEGLFLPR